MHTKALQTSKRVQAFGLALAVSLLGAAMISSTASAISLTPVAPATYPVPINTTATWASFNWGTKGAHQCYTADGSGQLTSEAGGEMTITFKGCQNSCTSPGQATGTMVSSNLEITPVYLNAAKTKWGFKLTPIGTSVFAECEVIPGSKIVFKYTGSVLGEMGPASTLYHRWGSAWNEQEFQQIEGAGTKYHLQLEGFLKGELLSSSPTALFVQSAVSYGKPVKFNP